MAEEESVATEEPTEEVDDLGDFDKDRALATIKAQRASEKSLKAELAAAKAAEAELAALKQAEDDAKKSAEQKLAEKDAKIASLNAQIAKTAVKADFMAKATSPERAYLDPELAYLAAEAQGCLGSYSPKTGQVEEHNFDLLEEKYPALRGEGDGATLTGDAGVRRVGSANNVGSQFNQAVRGALRR